MSVSAVIPHRNSGGLLDRCLNALEGSGVDEIVVADEASTDGSAERVAARRSVRVVQSPGQGFAAAANAGIAAAGGEWLLLLGSDAFVRPGAVARLLGRLEANPRLAACGAGLLNEDGTRSKTYSRLFTLPRALADALGFRPEMPQEGQGLTPVEAVFPNCLLARRTAIEEIGGFDERFRFYYEDMDLCRRLRQAGWELGVDWEAEAVHEGGGSTKGAGPGSWFRQYHASRLAYLRKHYPRGWLLYSAVWAPKAALHALAWRSRAAARALQGDAEASRAACEWARAFRRAALPLRPGLD